MSTKWSTETIGRNGDKPDLGALLKDESRIMLLRGKNVFGDFIYCYLKVAYPDVAKLKAAISGPDDFNLRNFGEVLAAGKGDPPADVVAEIDAAYPPLTPQEVPDERASGSTISDTAAPPQKKNWDEY